ncbi:MAG TPA: aminomethyl-transferring glycine dehydrogenase subunit GcvPA [Clostridia bacterium]|nr:aminomethyl-transferring glycine dehydrogenase subunit GcvPA [Clostridia bacterium]
MLDEIGVSDVSELFSGIPNELRFKGVLNLPKPLLSEYILRRHVEGLLSKNKSCKEYLNFLGAGCWQHYVPAVCDEISSRAEFLTAYVGDTYSDLGKYQALFEFQSMMGELVGMDVVSAPTYDWASACSSSLLMAARITGRSQVLIPRVVNPEKLWHMRNFFRSTVDIEVVEYDHETGQLDLEDLEKKISSKTAAVYFENPSYLGFIETHAAEISRIAHAHGALSVVGVDPTSLGILAPPSEYGADIVCGEAQPLGVHMNYGGGLCGFIASRDEEQYVAEYPTFLISIAPTRRAGEFGFGWCTHERTSFYKRERATDFTGTTQCLWGISAAVYLALLGPQGLRDLGESIMERSHYAMKVISEIDGVKAPMFSSVVFKEFVVNFDAAGKSVRDINKGLLRHKIHGGKDITREFPELGNSALYCVTEIHTKEDIDRLASALKEVLK